jgi:hypothetical protein
MNFIINPKFNVGDTVFYINPVNNEIKSTKITNISVVFNIERNSQSILYIGKNNYEFSESDHNFEWWSSKKDVINYLKL